MSDKDVLKLCGICGDKAHGYNFNAITCESCKAFFRRNALRKKEFKCPFDSNCKIDSVTRKFCKKCRLRKCFEIGMKKEWILSDDEKLTLRNKIAENRKKRQIQPKVSKVADSTTSSYNFPNVVQLIQNSYTINDKSLSPDAHNGPQYIPNGKTDSIGLALDPKRGPELHQNLFDSNNSSSESSPASNASTIKLPNNENLSQLYDKQVLNECQDCYEPQGFPSKPQYFPIEVIKRDSTYLREQQFANKCSVITGLSIESIKNNCIDSIGSYDTKADDMDVDKVVEINDKKDDIPEQVYQKAIELEFAVFPLKELKDQEFNKYEQGRLSELANAAIELNSKMNQISNNGIKITSEFNEIYDATKVLANKCDESIRKLVIMSKHINGFRELCQQDQIALMKAGCFEILIMRSVVNYNYEHDYWPVVMDKDNAVALKLDVFKQAKGNLYEAHRKFMHSFKKEWDNDKSTLDLLTAIILFTPNRPNIVHKEIIKLEQQTYMYLLQRHLISKYKSKCEAKMKFLRYLSKLEELHILHDEHIRIYLEVDPQDVGPLLLEILDLNPYKTLQVL